jgi:hypothetical protein
MSTMAVGALLEELGPMSGDLLQLGLQIRRVELTWSEQLVRECALRLAELADDHGALRGYAESASLTRLSCSGVRLMAPRGMPSTSPSPQGLFDGFPVLSPGRRRWEGCSMPPAAGRR